MKRLIRALFWFCLVAMSGYAAEVDYAQLRQQAQKHLNDGNYQDALDLFQRLALAADNDPALVGLDLQQGVQCMRNLNQDPETGPFIEAVIAAHPANWRLLLTAAQTYDGLQHWGFIVGGVFERGQHRGGGQVANSSERDRVRALQLLDQGLPLVEAAGSASERSGYYLHFARSLLGHRGQTTAWRLQYLTNLSELPDYDEGYGYERGDATQGAPVDEAGNPIFYQVPKGWEAAQSDGERWRWLLTMAMEADTGRKDAVLYEFATFLYQQFGVHTLQQYGSYFWREPAAGDEAAKADAVFALDTLGDDETIARLATGVKRFKLPDEFNYIKLFKQIDGGRGSSHGYQAVTTLANLYQNRRQYPAAAACWKRAIEVYQQENLQSRLDQIVEPWGRFEPGKPQPAGREGELRYRFRNGRKVKFYAHEVRLEQLLKDVQAYLKTNPGRLDWNLVNINDIGHRLVMENQDRYIGDRAAGWDLDLDPAPAHFDRLLQLKAPLDKAGVYLVTAEMAGGNTSRILLWLSDTVILKKQLDKQVFYYVADAVNGQPIAKANVEFFGYRTEHVDSKLRQALGRNLNVYTRQFAEYTDADGRIVFDEKQQPPNHNWLIIARQDNRLAYLGFTGVWYGNYYDQQYNETKVLFLTDRPVYRPSQTVRFKAWVRHAKYDQEFDSSFAGQSFRVIVHNPKGEECFNQALTADAYGGVAADLSLPADATLGVYRLWIDGVGGDGNFRVEEYKKPEFEVTVDAPVEPIQLGDKAEATVVAKYYFGAPVVKARVKYKVLRSAHRTSWYPAGDWDWFYGPGYWWFGCDYPWYPGWGRWGCMRPIGWWWQQPSPPPEVVLEGETQIGPDGTYKLPIDTALAKAVHGDTDHRYSITVEVTDDSRRTIVGSGSLLAARQPFRVYTWVDKGFYYVRDTILAGFNARTPDGKPVKATGTLTLFKVTYDAAMAPQEEQVQQWTVTTGDDGQGRQQLTASAPGQYRLSTQLADAAGHVQEGAFVFTVRGEGFDSSKYRFNAIELMTDKKEYRPGDTVELVVNVNRADAAVLLFIRPANGIYLPPTVVHLKGKTHVENLAVTKKDMPNFFVEAVTVADGEVFTEMREIVVPPEQRVLNVEVLPSAAEYKPGAKAAVKLRLTDFDGEPFSGSTVVTVYDKAVEYISGGSNVPEIREFFWKWRRQHTPQTEHNLGHWLAQLLKRGETPMNDIGVFGGELGQDRVRRGAMLKGRMAEMSFAAPMAAKAEASAMTMAADAMESVAAAPVLGLQAAGGMAAGAEGGAGEAPAMVEPTVRSNFADTAFWAASIQTDRQGFAEFSLDMPENLTTWMIRTWAMGHGTRVGQGLATVVTTKNLLLRLQAPRFFVEKDEVVLSANVHNYLKTAKSVQVVLELEGGTLEPMPGVQTTRTIDVEATGEQRVDWRVKVIREGEAVIRMKALTDEESDAMQMRFPVKVHGADKMIAFSGQIRPDATTARVEFEVPVERRVETGRLEVRYSPTLAGAMVDALPYLLEFPYGCTEQTLNRFVPAVITQKILLDMGLDLKEIRDKLSNLNAQEIGDDKARAGQWQKDRRWTHDEDGNLIPYSPVFDQDRMQRIVQDGVVRLTAQQLSDGGWGWFSGWGEQSYPHTTAVVVHGLQLARDNDVAIVPNVIESGIEWLARYQAEELEKLDRGDEEKPKHPYKLHADNLDAMVYMVLVDEKRDNPKMREHLYKDRTGLAVYAKAMFGLALHKLGDLEKRDMIIRNIEQFLVKDAENQTAWLNLGNDGYWWYWYGSEYEAHAYYLKLLAATAPKGETAPWLVKYLLNNRKHASYWNSTRDTAVVIEAFADFMRASGEDQPNLNLEVVLDGQLRKTVKIDRSNLFTFDNKVVLTGQALASGKHALEFRKTGTGPIYFNAYVSYFSLEDYIRKAGLEIKVERHYYKLVPVDKTIKAAGARGQAVDQKVEKYQREALADLATLKSGDLVEIELLIESKNDYEYIVFEDLKAAGFEPVDVQSGYSRNGLGAYMELRDDRVAFFVRSLARGKHSIAYRLRAEIPGRFSALPTQAWAMYAPELRANADEIKLNIED